MDLFEAQFLNHFKKSKVNKKNETNFIIGQFDDREYGCLCL